MKRKVSIIRLIISEISAVGLLVIPIALWYFEDYPAATAMAIYALESAGAIVLAILCVVLISPKYDPDGPPKYKSRSVLLKDFSIVAFALLAAIFLFFSLFVFLVLRVSIDPAQLAFGFGVVLVFLLADLINNLVTLRPLSLKNAEQLLTQSMGKAALLFLAIFIGMFLAGLVNEWFVLPFVVLKAIVELGEPIQTYFGKDRSLLPVGGAIK